MRRGLSAGAIIGISLGATALLLAIVLVVVVSLVSTALPTLPPGAAPAAPSTPAPTAAPTSPSAPADASMEPYDVDGVHVRPLDNWAFELTSAQACPGAVVTVGFSSTADGDVVQEWSEPVRLDAGVPYYLTIPYSASTYDFAGIDAIQCQST